MKKATELHGSMGVSECEPSLAKRCSRDHAHHKVRGTTRAGINYSALAAAYPQPMCAAMVRLAKQAEQRVEDNARSPAGGSTTTHGPFSKTWKTVRALHPCTEEELEDKVARLLGTLREAAVQLELGKAWGAVVGPWVHTTFESPSQIRSVAAAVVESERLRFSPPALEKEQQHSQQRGAAETSQMLAQPGAGGRESTSSSTCLLYTSPSPRD